MALPPPNQQDGSRFDFFEGVRSYNYREIVRPLLEDYGRRAAAAGEQPLLRKEDVAPLYNTDPAYLFSCAIQRSMQQMAWATAVESVEREADDIAVALETARHRQEHGSLELVEGAELPSWYTWHTEQGLDDIHLVPGGYWRHDLVGAVHHPGRPGYPPAWRSGYDARPGALERFAHYAPPRDHARVLDLGCSFGGLTRALRKTFEDAEIIGIDISAPALKYAHYVTEELGLSITFAQRDATATGYEGASFDLVTAFLLLHEVPDDVRAEIIAEAYRILKPGGTLLFLDIPPYQALAPEQAFFESFDGRGNGENHWEAFLSSDLPGLLVQTGFVEVTEGPLDFDEPGYWGSSALWRTGEFDPVHRWVTCATKPAADGGPDEQL